MDRPAVPARSDDWSAVGNQAELRQSNYARYIVWGVLAGVLLSEMIVLRLPYDSRADFPDRALGAQLLLFFQQSVEPTMTTALVVASFLSIATLREEFHRAL